MTTTIPHTVFDHGVGADFDAVHIHPVRTPDGVFVTDGCALIHTDWCDTTTHTRIEHIEPRTIDSDWWQRSFHTRTSNIVDGYPQVTIRPWYQLCLDEAGADLKWRSNVIDALIALDEARRLRAIIGAWASPYRVDSFHKHQTDINHLIETYKRHAPHMHPHHAAVAALVAVDERDGAESVQLDPLAGVQP